MAVSFLEGQLAAGSSSVSRRLEIRIGNRVACERAWLRLAPLCLVLCPMGVSVHA